VYRVELDRGDLGDGMRSIERCREAGEQGGFGFAAVATRADLARVLAYLGDGERALRFAEQARATARDDFPPAVPVAAIAEAEARIVLGDLDGARGALDHVGDAAFPEPDRTFAFVGSRSARSRLALASGDAEAAAAAADEVITRLRSNAVRILVAQSLVTLARARFAQGRFDEAERELLRALDAAQQLGERTASWEALAVLAEVRGREGRADEAADLRRRAREIVDEIAVGIADVELRSAFLARDDVVSLGERT